MSKDPSADQIICAGGFTTDYLVHNYIIGHKTKN